MNRRGFLAMLGAAQFAAFRSPTPVLGPKVAQWITDGELIGVDLSKADDLTAVVVVDEMNICEFVRKDRFRRALDNAMGRRT